MTLRDKYVPQRTAARPNEFEPPSRDRADRPGAGGDAGGGRRLTPIVAYLGNLGFAPLIALAGICPACPSPSAGERQPGLAVLWALVVWALVAWPGPPTWPRPAPLEEAERAGIAHRA